MKPALGAALCLGSLGFCGCTSARALEDNGMPASIRDQYPPRVSGRLDFAADLQVSAAETASASLSHYGVQSDVYPYPLKSMLKEVFSSYFVPSLFSQPFEGQVESAFRVEVRASSCRMTIQGERAL